MYDAFREVGGNFIDTANLHGRTSQSFLGGFIRATAERGDGLKYTNAARGRPERGRQ